jgi:PAS domain S-box-containing protein
MPASLFKFLESLGEHAWQHDLETHEVHASETFWNALGYETQSVPRTREAARELMHATDAQLAEEELELHLQADEPFEFEIRLRASNGEWRCIRFRGSLIERNAKGEPRLIGGILADITADILMARKHSRAEDLIGTLSNRERQVLGCLVAGAANKNIAYALGISQRTVEGYRARLMEKLGVRGAAELIQVAIDGGLTADGSAECSPRLAASR